MRATTAATFRNFNRLQDTLARAAMPRLSAADPSAPPRWETRSPREVRPLTFTMAELR